MFLALPGEGYTKENVKFTCGTKLLRIIIRVLLADKAAYMQHHTLGRGIDQETG